ncbi:hypothetical protein PI95_024175 [Hassallia byssoidea VB512170]|uniref:Uncharacterized protein n=1 Tax=Hassallia byssoidea VB512170 TaxID=1304833 RepID=A0A846HFZ8_9CYAN|nr:hypothetical protein [Hassalia byssoidea]NEU75570.1 hypothetical protein [Hassalia byssoidea VB512170]
MRRGGVGEWGSGGQGGKGDWWSQCVGRAMPDLKHLAWTRGTGGILQLVIINN